jgi:hypothetical protein
MLADILVLIFVNCVAGYGRKDLHLIARIRSNHVPSCVHPAWLRALNDTQALEEQPCLPRPQRKAVEARHHASLRCALVDANADGHSATA